MTAAIKSPVPRPAEVTWYYTHGDARIGPITEKALLEALRQGLIQEDTLVWQNAFDRWKPAASIPMLAVNLKERNALLLRGTASQDAPPQPELQAMVYEDLTEAVTDEEAAEPEFDAQQLREILVRTSRPPPERTIPPASVTSTPPVNRSLAPNAFGTPQLIGFAASFLVLSTVVALFVLRKPRQDDAPTVAAKALQAPQSASTQAVARPREDAKLDTPKLDTPKLDTLKLDTPTPQSEPHLDREPANGQPSIRGGRSAATVVESGTLDLQLLVQKLQHGLPMYDDQCWDKLRAPVGEVAKDPSLRIELSIDRLGNVYDIASSKAPAGYRGVGLCIIGRMRGWKFPRAESGTHAVVTVTRFTSK